MIENVLAKQTVALGEGHPSTITSHAVMADLYVKMAVPDKASPLMEGIVAGTKRVFGPHHPEVACAIHNQAGLLKNQVRLFFF